MKVHIYAQRHGKRKDNPADEMTREGREQIIRSRTEGHLAGLTFSTLTYGWKRRHQEAASLVLGHQEAGAKMHMLRGLFPWDPANEADWNRRWKAVEDQMGEDGTSRPMMEWIRNMPVEMLSFMQYRLNDTLCEVALLAYLAHPNQELVQAYASTSTQYAELCAGSSLLMKMPPLKAADIIRYTVEVHPARQPEPAERKHYVPAVPGWPLVLPTLQVVDAEYLPFEAA